MPIPVAIAAALITTAGSTAVGGLDVVSKRKIENAGVSGSG